MLSKLFGCCCCSLCVNFALNKQTRKKEKEKLDQPQFLQQRKSFSRALNKPVIRSMLPCSVLFFTENVLTDLFSVRHSFQMSCTFNPSGRGKGHQQIRCRQWHYFTWSIVKTVWAHRAKREGRTLQISSFNRLFFFCRSKQKK